MLLQDLAIKVLKKRNSEDILRKIDTSILSHLAGFGHYGGGGLGESVKKGKFLTKIFFR